MYIKTTHPLPLIQNIETTTQFDLIKMVDHQVECLWSLISFLVHLLNVVRKAMSNLVAHRRVHSDDSGTTLVSKGCSLEESRVGDAKMVVDHHDQVKVVKKVMRKRPAMIKIPESCCVGSEFRKEEVEVKDLEVEGSGYCLASRRGKKRHVMEDGYGVITDINGDSKQAYFGVFDGHGGRAAVDFVSEKLGKNIIQAVDGVEGGDDKLEVAIRSGYLTTDKEFLSQGLNSGVCAATVLLNGGELHVGNVGDCRVVMSRKGEANVLTSDHSPGREDERARIESAGGYVSCRNGVWRVQDSLAVSRAIGDANLKEWIISEPETMKLQLTPDCEFLILASDGLWHTVNDQEAVDVVSRNGNLMKACKDLVDISCSRGSRDDITVMVVDLKKFIQFGGHIS